jgi:hypothetical protein
MAIATVLQLDPRRTLLLEWHDGPEVLSILVGRQDLAAVFHPSVTEAGIELAIERVEDAIGHPRVDIASILDVRDEDTLRLLAEEAGVPRAPSVVLTIEAVEQLFTRLVRQAAGALPSAERLPADARYAATLVLVREVMNHLRVSTLQIGP